jgi:ADP-ribose pyrophosphatase YjhB (NUDIX family)
VTDVPRVLVVTSAIVRRGDEVLLVERADGWALPGGAVEASEDATHALAREVAAETGLRVVTHRRLAYTVQYVRPAEITLAFVFEVVATGEPGSRARFLPVPDAIDCLRQFPMSEPVAGYLSGAEEAGAYWTYGDVAGTAAVTARVPGRAMR